MPDHDSGIRVNRMMACNQKPHRNSTVSVSRDKNRYRETPKNVRLPVQASHNFTALQWPQEANIFTSAMNQLIKKCLATGQTRSEIILIRICCGRQNVCSREVWSIMLRNHFRNTENTLRGLFLFPNRWRDRIFPRIICLFTSFSLGRAESRSRRSSDSCSRFIEKCGLSLVWQPQFCCTMQFHQSIDLSDSVSVHRRSERWNNNSNRIILSGLFYQSLHANTLAFSLFRSRNTLLIYRITFGGAAPNHNEYGGKKFANNRTKIRDTGVVDAAIEMPD